MIVLVSAVLPAGVDRMYAYPNLFHNFIEDDLEVLLLLRVHALWAGSRRIFLLSSCGYVIANAIIVGIAIKILVLGSGARGEGSFFAIYLYLGSLITGIYSLQLLAFAIISL